MNFAKTLRARISPNARKGLVLLAPSNSSETLISPVLAEYKGWNHESLLAELQRFRGKTYLADGAITKEALDCEGRHCLEADNHSWHMLMLDAYGEVCGCSRYRTFRAGDEFENLSVGRSALAQSDQWGQKLRAAVDRERRNAQKEGASFVEVGGWAISECLRGTIEAIRIALATFALGQCLGGCISLTTATERHSSADLLRRIGGQPLHIDNTELPKYFDPEYECEMQILRFDSSSPNPKFAPMVEQLKLTLESVPVIASRRDLRVPFWTDSAEAESNFGIGLQPIFT